MSNCVVSLFDNIDGEIRRKHTSQEELCNYLGIERRTYLNWKNKKSMPVTYFIFGEVGLGILALHDVYDPAVRVDEQGACALRADVARQHQRFAQDDSLLRFIFALYTKYSFGSVPEEAARGDDIHAEAEHVRDHDIAAADTL